MSSESERLFPLLAAFDALATEGSVTGAAARLGVPQSSLSRRVHAVEEALGVPLVRRTGRTIVLTAQGREFHERTRDLVWSLDHTIRSLTENADPDAGLVRFGFPLSLSPRSVPGLLADFHTKFPRIRLNVVQAYGDELVRELRSGHLDVAIVIPAPTDVPTTVLGQQPLDCYVSADHALAGRDSVALVDLAQESFIANPRSYHLRSTLESWCIEAGFVPHVPFEITEFDTIRALTAQGLGVSVLPPPESSHPGLVRVPLRGSYSRSVGLSAALDEPIVPVRRLHHFISSNRDRLREWIELAEFD